MAGLQGVLGARHGQGRIVALGYKTTRMVFGEVEMVQRELCTMQGHWKRRCKSSVRFLAAVVGLCKDLEH